MLFLLLSACGTGLAGPCDARALSKGLTAVASAPEDMRADLAGRALAEACTGLEPSLVASLNDFGVAPPEYRRMQDAKLVADNVTLWIAACPAGPGVLADAMSVAREDFGGVVHERCGLDALGFTAAELSGDGYPLTAVVLRKALRDAGAPAVETTQLTRLLAGR